MTFMMGPGGAHPLGVPGLPPDLCVSGEPGQSLFLCPDGRHRLTMTSVHRELTYGSTSESAALP